MVGSRDSLSRRTRGWSQAALATPAGQIKELAAPKESGLVTADEFDQKEAELRSASRYGA
jgi:hypothetical protein